MKINNRLKTIGDLVPLSSYPLDIGCDHGLLSIYLVKERHLLKVKASDNKLGPLNSAKENIDKYQVEDKVILELADGLNSYEKGIDTVTISGMGGIAICQIIEDRKDIINHIETLIISPNNYVTLVRKTLNRLGYMLQEEILIKEKHLYPILVFCKGKKKYTKKELFLGPIFLQKQDKLTCEYYQKLMQERIKLISLLPKIHFKKRFQLKQEMIWLEEISLNLTK